jgi:site-specific recombinase XerD
MTRLTARSLTKDIDQFLVFKHALGYPYQRGEATLRSFQRFAFQKLGRNATIDLDTTIKAWLSRGSNRKPVTRGLELGPVRQRCHFRRRRDPRGYVPSVSLAPQTESHYVPYIFSIEQIRAMVEAAGRHQGRNFWSGLLRLLILTTYCTGLRLGETVRLRCADVDLHTRVLRIRASKGRTRLVPFGEDLAREFRQYWPQRDELLRRKGHDRADALLIGRYGRAISLKAASEALRRIRNRCLAGVLISSADRAGRIAAGCPRRVASIDVA